MFTHAHAEALMSASMSSPSPSLSRCSVLSYGAFISQCCLVLSFGASIHLAICTSTLWRSFLFSP